MYGPEIPLNANFDVVSWKARAVGMRAPDFTGNGSNVANIANLKRQVPSGTVIYIRAKIRRPDGVIEDVEGTWTKP